MELASVAAFSATLVDNKEAFDKLALSLQDIANALTSREAIGTGAGAVLGGLAGHASSSDPEEQKRRAIVGALGGGALGGTVSHFLGGGSSGGEESSSAPGPSDPTLTPRAGGPKGVSGPSKALKSQLISQPISGPQTLGDQRAAIDASQAYPRLQQTGRAAQQRAQQMASQNIIRQTAARERAALMQDQGRVRARLQALLAPQPSQGTGPRNIRVGPGGRPVGSQTPSGKLKGAPMGGLKTGEAYLDAAYELYKSADVMEDISRFAKNNPWAVGAAGGGILGAGTGWAARGSDKERKRKMLINGLIGAMAGGGLAQVGSSITDASDAVQKSVPGAAKAIEELGGQAGATMREAERTVGTAHSISELLRNAAEDNLR